MKTVYLLAGHSMSDPGAIGVGGRKEADETIKLRNAIAEILKEDGVVVVIDNDRNNLAQVLKAIESTEDDIVFDIHFNSNENGAANGVECFVPNRYTSKEMTLARNIATNLSRIAPFKLRGLAGVTTELNSHRGSLGVMRENGTNVLLEVCFISNQSDMNKYDAAFNEIAEVIATNIKSSLAT